MASGGTCELSYPEYIAFIHSPQIIRATFSDDADIGTVEIRLRARNQNNMIEYYDIRRVYNGCVEWDISRMLQHISPDIDKAAELGEAGAAFSISGATVVFKSATGPVSLSPDLAWVNACGALDQGESYHYETERKRLWLNFPQTFNCWTDKNSYVYRFIVNGVSTEMSGSPAVICKELDLIKSYILDPSAFHHGEKIHVRLSTRGYVYEGKFTEASYHDLILTADTSPRDAGTYLRWLNRRGEFSYWLFTNSKLRTVTTMADNFARYYEGDPSIPENGLYRNAQKASYREAREMTLGAVGLSLEEYEDLCSLATSPVVDMLLPDTTEERWQRVNVAAGTFERNIRRSTPSLQDLEFVIELPERNTIKL